MEFLVASLTENTRTEVLHGRRYLVGPMVLIRPGVLQGSKGPLFYPVEEVSKNPSVWNGTWIVNGHPQVDGVPVSARSPDVINRYGLGHVFNARYEDGVLKADGWFDVEMVRRNAPELSASLEKGKAISISTGLFTSDEPVGNKVHTDGRTYTHIARDYSPDHLAILPSGKGACSLEDGCGLNVNNSDEQTSPTKKCECGPDESCAECVAEKPTENDDRSWVKKLIDLAVNAFQPHSSDTGRFKSPNAGTGKAEIRDPAQLGTIELTPADRALGEAAAVHLAVVGDSAPEWVSDGAKWDRARAAADKGGYAGSTYWATVSHIYQGMGGGIKGNSDQDVPGSKATDELGAASTPISTDNAFCPTGEGVGVDPGCSPGGGGSGSGPKPPTVPGLKKIFSELGGDISVRGGGSAPVLEGKIAIGKTSVDTKGFKFKQGINPGEVNVIFKGTGSVNVLRQGEATMKAAKAKMKEMGYEIDEFPTNPLNITVRLPKSKPTGNVHTPTLNYIRKKGDKYCIYSEKGKKLGEYPSRAAAEKRLKQIEYFKRKKDNAFCPTGEGGGVDPSCSPGGGSGSSKSSPRGMSRVERAASTLFEGAYLDKKQIKDWADFPDDPDPKFKLSTKEVTSYLKSKLNERGLDLIPLGGVTVSRSSRGGGQTGKASGFRVTKQDTPATNSPLTNSSFAPEDPVMPFKTKAQAVQSLTANCGCWEGKDKILNALDEATVIALADEHEQFGAVANALREASGDSTLTINAMPAFIKKKVAAEDEEYMEEEEEVPAKKTKKTPVLENADMTANEWLEKAPPEVREQIAFGRRMADQHRANLVSRLTANEQDPAKKKTKAAALNKRSLADLEELVSYLPSPSTADCQQSAPPVYLGFGPDVTTNAPEDDYKPEGLTFNQTDWAEVKKSEKARPAVRAE